MTTHDPKPDEELAKDTESEGTVEHAEAEATEATDPGAATEPQETIEGEPPTQPDEDAKPDA